MSEQRADRTRMLKASYRYSVNKFQARARKIRPETARESPRQRNVEAAHGNSAERIRTRPTMPVVVEREEIDKEVTLLKKNNKRLSSENAKLKTNNFSLEAEVCNLKDALQQKPEKKHLIRTESAAATAMFSSLKKELEETKLENIALKRDMKHVKLTELQAERQANAAELERLRDLLKQEKEVSEGLKQERREMKEQHRLKRKEMQAAIQKLQQENHYLRQNKQREADRVRDRSREQMKKFEHLSQATLDMKAQIQALKKQLEKSQQQCNETRNKLHSHTLKSTKEAGSQANQKCPKCKSLKSENTKSKNKIQQLRAQIKELSRNRVMNEELTPPTREESDHLRKFITLRLAGLAISLEQAIDAFHGDEDSRDMAVLDVAGIFTAEPFAFMTDRYHQILIFHLCLTGQQPNEDGNITVNENKKVPIDDIMHNFRKFLGKFTIPSEPQRKQLFKTVAEFLTDQKLKILELLEMSNNADGITINQDKFRHVMSELGVSEDCIVEMIRTMVIQSPDLNHLDYRILFETFVVENVADGTTNPNPEIVPYSSTPQHSGI